MNQSRSDGWAGCSPADVADRRFAGRYLLSNLIGTGGMATVWRAEDSLLSRVVAIKVLHREYASDPVARSRFRAEARAAASISHPNVVSVFDYGDTGATAGAGAPFLVMELVEGRSLAEELDDRGSLPSEEAAKVLEQVALGLSAAHALHIIHRDIKPGNLLVTTSGTVKITDFGIARAADAVSLTRTGTVMGTARYISPEQAAGQPAGPESDLYSLGVVAYTCLSGAPPFAAETPLATALAHLRDPVPPLPDATPVALRLIVLRLLAKNPADRPRDALEVATLARNAVHGGAGTPTAAAQTRGRGVSGLEPTAQMIGPPQTEVWPTGLKGGPEWPGPRGVSWAKRVTRRRPVMLFLLVLLAAAIGGFVLLLSATPTQKVPGVVADPVAMARATLQHHGLAASLRPSDGPKAAGYVLSQSPSAGTVLRRGQTVELTVSSGFVQINASNYTSSPFGPVAAELTALGLHPAESFVSGDSTPGLVVTVSPQGRVPVGSMVQVEVDAAPPPAPQQPLPAADNGPNSGSGRHHGKRGD
jgi:eukaryotic-like serine/threonine-protein kinase